MTLYFVRHGESLANEQNYFAGAQNSPLTRLGRQQAQQAADRIRRLGVVFDEVHVSTLERAQATACIILEGNDPGAPRVVFTDALVERDFGIFAGENKTLIKKSLGFRLYDHFFHSRDGTPPQGESWTAMFARCKRYYDDVLAPLERLGKHVLVVAHKYIVEMFALLASGLSPEQYIDFKLPNSRPLSWDDLKRLTASTSSSLNYIGEHIEIFLLHGMLLASLAGFALSIAGVTLPHALSNVAVALLLAVNAFFLALRVEPSSLRSKGGPETVALVVLCAARLIAGGVLLGCFHSQWQHLVGLLLIVPPALSVPAFSLARGGDYFFATRNTLVLSVVMPIVLLAICAADQPIVGDAHALHRFFIVLLVARAIPALLAQGWRRVHPIVAGRLSTNWGWIGSLAMIPLAFLTSLRAGGLPLANALQSGHWLDWVSLLLPFAIFGVSRIGSALYVQLQSLIVSRPIRPSVACDLHLLQTSPNIFLWLTLLMPATLHDAPTLVAGTLLGFFAFAFSDEAIVVRRFRFRIGPTALWKKQTQSSSLGRTG
ncbi:histidine phosphatase family protein [Paraburkholderia madseniana]|uniref:histidine phosphatase family protein n=1 Tax=Paraburkholderia madseniana TaxID=2599607 RepID=UPI001A005748|nr:histidine phosphatase family protein [Paraburkholderia madseniana]NPT68551.1 hypothetical protein [Paraburkholderia madseniana]